MYRIARCNQTQPADIQAFLALINKLDEHPFIPAREIFNSRRDLSISRAPGRLDVMGGIADYSGSLVLEWPIAEATFAAVQLSPEAQLNVVTLIEDEPHHLSFAMPLGELVGLEYGQARAYFRQDRATQWAAYVAGVFLVLMREKDLELTHGANILISSRVPPGKGVSSSAALEVAVMQAVTHAFHLPLDPRELALLCQRVENLVVGAPCGVMDQMTAVFGERDRLLMLLCQPAELKGSIELPPQLRLWGIDSGIRHSVSGSDYGSVRAATFMGHQLLGLSSDDYLANITPAEFEERYRARLPEPVRIATAHPIYEHARVQRFVELLGQRAFRELGELMYASHESYTALGLNSEGTDLIVELVRREPELFGAKITGGGSGGTVAVLGDANAEPAIKRVVESYANKTGHRPYVFSGSSSGAAAFGVRSALSD